jgi:hypothetical protein
LRRYTVHEVLTYAKFMGEVELERRANNAWLTAMLTATGTNAPKSFPKSPSELLTKILPPKPMTKRQWEGMFDLLFTAFGGKDEKDKPAQQANRRG